MSVTGVVRDATGGAIAAAWRHVYPGNLRDIAAVTSADVGRTFTAPQRVSEDRWAIDGCPENGPSVAFHAGRLQLAWPTVVGGHEPAGAIFYASARDGSGFSPRVRVPALAGRDPEHVQIAGAKADRLIVAWDEVVEGLNPRDYTIRNAIDRMERLGADPVRPVLSETPDLVGVLHRLAGLLTS